MREPQKASLTLNLKPKTMKCSSLLSGREKNPEILNPKIKIPKPETLNPLNLKFSNPETKTPAKSLFPSRRARQKLPAPLARSRLLRVSAHIAFKQNLGKF